MYWLEVSLTVDGEAAEAISELLKPYAYQQVVVLEQSGDQSSPEPDALTPEITVKIFIPGEDDTPQLRKRISESIYYLGMLYPIPDAAYRALEDKDWAYAWRENYRPFRIGKRIVIRPSWLTHETAAPDDIVITLDPGMAFGTGLHPSTQMCVELLERYVNGTTRVLDVGTGSGILAIAAAKLGAPQVVAFDNDYVASRTTHENAALNDVTSNVMIYNGTLDSLRVRPFEIIVVNILAPVITSLIRDKSLFDYCMPGGCLILSGIIEQQREQVRLAVEEAGAELVVELTIRDWVALLVKRKSPYERVV